MSELNQPNQKSRWFIALIPPQDMQDYANQVKQQFADQYASRKAFTSPPHVTLHPPFIIPTVEITETLNQLAAFAADRPPIPVTLSGFGAFPPRVIYIQRTRLRHDGQAWVIHQQFPFGQRMGAELDV